jgi:polyisoprenyl-teichoic acid--peptidoglycan teichoic acid transferase
VIRRMLALGTIIATASVAIPMIGGAPASSAPSVLAGRVHASYQPNDGKIFVLVIGNDAREGNPDSARADALHIVGINTKTMKGGILNFPRDSWVSIPGYGSGRINEALIAGGPERVAQTLENITGIKLDYWVMVGFEGFRDIITDVGRVKMRIPTRVYDPTGSGAKIEAGVQDLGPLNSLAYVRTRHSFAGGDIARTTHQADFLLALLRKLNAETASNPASLMKWIGATKSHARFNLSGDEMFRLGVLTTQLDAKDVGNVTVPVSMGMMGSASVVFIQPGAQSIYARFRENGSL